MGVASPTEPPEQPGQGEGGGSYSSTRCPGQSQKWVALVRDI